MANNITNDPSTRLGNGHVGHVVHIVHVATRATCHFKAFLTAWEDNFKQDWNSYETVGRMDPVKTYKRTSRVITFSLDIPSYDKEDAARNLKEIQTLIQMSYPTFSAASTTGKQITSAAEASSEATQQKAAADTAKVLDSQRSLSSTVSHMVSPPFLRIKFSNWLNDASLDPGMSSNDAMSPDRSHEEGDNLPEVHSTNQGTGLYGTIENVKFAPDLSENGGFYGANDLYSKFENTRTEKILIPKLLKLDLVFNVLHTNDLGYYANSLSARDPNYPYNAYKIHNKIRTIVK